MSKNSIQSANAGVLTVSSVAGPFSPVGVTSPAVGISAPEENNLLAFLATSCHDIPSTACSADAVETRTSAAAVDDTYGTIGSNGVYASMATMTDEDVCNFTAGTEPFHVVDDFGFDRSLFEIASW